MSDTKTNQAPPPAQGQPGVPLSAALREQLEAPFAEGEVKFKPAMTKGDRALALPYVDARVIMRRLDDVFGVAGWQDSYQVIADGSVICTLRVKIGWEWIAKTDVGGQSEQPDEGDRVKSAFSDALKRAAVKFGIGRYLYRQPSLWMDWDPQKKRFVREPRLPVQLVDNGVTQPAARSQKAAKKPDKPARGMPIDGAELFQRLKDYDAKLTAEGLCDAGEMVSAVRGAGKVLGYPEEIARWAGPQIAFAVREVKQLEAAARAQKPVHAN